MQLSQTTNQPTSQTISQTISLGSYLKSERELRGVDLAEVAAETRVPEASLRSIEEDRLDDLPGEVFVRGFVKAYARCIGLDVDEVLARIDRPAPRLSMPLVHSTTINLRRRRIASPAVLFVLLLASLLIGLVLWRPVTVPSLSSQGTPPPTHSAG
jgi:cytoskeletal protein RodZ